jgi:hypothetical protein
VPRYSGPSWYYSNGKPQAFGFTRGTFEAIEQFISDNKHDIARVNAGMDLLVRGFVLVIKGEAQKRSQGPVAPGRRSVPILAHRIPVQRITGYYYAGWTQRKLANGVWYFYNQSKEAYLIETGLFQRLRRPILKLSMISALRFLQTTRTGERFMESMLGKRRSYDGRFRSFNTRLQGTDTLSMGTGYGTWLGGSSSGKGVLVTEHPMAGPQGKLPG